MKLKTMIFTALIND